MARQGDYNAALSLLIDPSVWRGLILRDYEIWADQLWDILALRATRRWVFYCPIIIPESIFCRGQFRLYRELLLPRRPNVPFNPKEYLFHVESGKLTAIRESLYQVLQLRVRSIFTLLQSINVFISKLIKLRLGSIICSRHCGGPNFFVDSPTTGLRSFCLRILGYNLVWLDDQGKFWMKSCPRFDMIPFVLIFILIHSPKVITGDDLEQRAVACFTLARCIIAAGDSTSQSPLSLSLANAEMLIW